MSIKRASIRGLLLAYVVACAAACDSLPGFYGGLGEDPATQINGTVVTLARHDNVVALGTHIPWQESWRYYATPDATRADTSEQLVWADAAANDPGLLVELQSSHAIFAGNMARANFAFSLPAGGSSTVLTTSFSTTTVPWIFYSADCQTLYDPACAQYRSRPAPNQSFPYSFPYLVGNINLPAGQQVRIDSISKYGVAGARWSTGSQVMESGFYKTHPDLIVVPVHLHIFVDGNNNMKHGFMGGLTNSDAGRIDMAHRVRKVFDDYLVKVVNVATATSSTSWHREYRTKLTRNPLDAASQQQVFDNLLTPCNVQVQLQSVDFIRQSNGLESAEIGYGNARQRTPWWDASDPTRQRNAELMTSYIRAMNTVAGAHVFVVGSVNSGDFSSFETAGIGWDQNGTTSGYALISGKSAANGNVPGASNTLSHEMGHVLGLRHDRNGDEITKMLSLTLAPASCSSMASAARRLLVAASTL